MGERARERDRESAREREPGRKINVRHCNFKKKVCSTVVYYSTLLYHIIYVRTYVCMYVCMYVRTNVCMNVCMYVCMYV